MIDMYRKVTQLLYAERLEVEYFSSLPSEVDASLLIAEHAEMKAMYQATVEWLKSYFDFEHGRTDTRPLPRAEFMEKLTNYVSTAHNAEKKAYSEHKWNEVGRLHAIQTGRTMALLNINDMMLHTKATNAAVKELMEHFPNFEIGFVEDLVNTHPEKARDLLALYEIRAHCEPNTDYVKAIEIGIDAIEGKSDRVFGEPEEMLVRSVSLLREDSKKRGAGILSDATTCAANCIESLLKAYSDLGRG